MCGRYTLTRFDHPLLERIPAQQAQPTWNRAPGTPAPVVGLNESGQPGVVAMHWGFRPHFMPDGPELINARAETVAEKPMFRAAFRRHRCVVPADGFFEWKPVGERKQPWYIRHRDGDLFFFAGIWTRLPEASRDGCTHGYAILTTAARGWINDLHHRQPAILSESDLEAWMAPDTGPGRLALLLSGAELTDFEAWPVSTRVNRPEHDDPDCIAPVEAEKGG